MLSREGQSVLQTLTYDAAVPALQGGAGAAEGPAGAAQGPAGAALAARGPAQAGQRGAGAVGAGGRGAAGQRGTRAHAPAGDRALRGKNSAVTARTAHRCDTHPGSTATTQQTAHLQAKPSRSRSLAT